MNNCVVDTTMVGDEKTELIIVWGRFYYRITNPSALPSTMAGQLTHEEFVTRMLSRGHSPKAIAKVMSLDGEEQP